MIFFEDHNSYSLYTTSINSEVDIDKGLWLLLIGINDVPPHIALINEAKYYSLSARTVDCGSSSGRLLNILRRKNIPALFIRIETKNTAASYLEKIYKNLQPLGNNQNTCLSPIKELFTECHSDEFASVYYVFELLALAEKKNLVIECVSAFYENTNANSVTLPKYTITEIRNKIHTISSQITFIK